MVSSDDRRSLTRFESEVLSLLRSMNAKIDDLRNLLANQGAKASSREWDELDDSELIAKIAEAKRDDAPYDVLDLRRILVGRLSEPDRQELDRELADWFTRHFHASLRAGKAAVVAGAIERAVEEIGDIAEMQLLAESLPTVLRSVGLLLDLKADELDRDDPS